MRRRWKAGEAACNEEKEIEKSPKIFLDDGLDYFLDACDSAKAIMGDLSDDEEGGEKMKLEVGDSSDSEEELIEGVDYDVMKMMKGILLMEKVV